MTHRTTQAETPTTIGFRELEEKWWCIWRERERNAERTSTGEELLYFCQDSSHYYPTWHFLFYTHTRTPKQGISSACCSFFFKLWGFFCFSSPPPFFFLVFGSTVCLYITGSFDHVLRIVFWWITHSFLNQVSCLEWRRCFAMFPRWPWALCLGSSWVWRHGQVAALHPG